MVKPPKPFEVMKFWRNHADEIRAKIDADTWGPHVTIGEFHFGLKAAKALHKWLGRAIAYMEIEAKEVESG